MRPPVPGALVVGLIAGLFCFAVVAADGATGTLDAQVKAQALYDAGHYAESLEVLRDAFREDPGNADLSFLMGLAAMQSGDYETAAGAFDRVLFMLPDSDRARVELARAYTHLGLYSVARGLFSEVVNKPETPEPVRQRVQRYLAHIDAVSREHRVGGLFSVSVVRDSNARVSPNGAVDLPGLPRLNVPIERDWFTAQSLIVDYRWRPRLRRLGWNADVLAYNAFYSSEDDLDVSYIRLDSGPQWDFGSWSAGVSGNGAFMEKDYQRYLGSYGARVWGAMKLSKELALRLESSVEQRRYWQVPGADGFSGSLALRPTYSRGRHRLALDAGYEFHNADDRFESYDKLFAGVSYQMSLPGRVTVMASYAYENWLFGGLEPLATARRRDAVNEVSIGLRKYMTANLAVALMHKYETSSSNSDLYDFDRNVTSLTMSYGF